MTYEAAVSYIASLESRGWRLGLRRMHAFCKAAGLEDALRGGFVHVGGTNGKGSTVAYLQSILVEAGYCTGAFFSPYVVDPRERVQFGREFIPKGDLAEITELLIPVAEAFTNTEFEGVTEFEFKTAIGFEFWRRKRCEWIAMEVGLGGTTDATNVITPRASAIVSIGLDHMALLGDSIAEIADKKAGIIKPGIPVVVGNVPAAALAVFEAKARETESGLWRYGVDFGWQPTGTVFTPTSRYDDLRPGLIGSVQGHNLAVAIAALEAGGCQLTPDAVRLGAERAYVPGRFQTIETLGTTFILDGAHNGEAAHVLAETLASVRPGERPILLTNMVQGHDPRDFYEIIAHLTDQAIVVPIESPRALPIEGTQKTLQDLGVSAECFQDLALGLERAASLAGPNGYVLVTGSYYLVGSIIRKLSEHRM